MKKQTGITLIALVITIIVLLILAGVSISMVIGQNGVLTQADDATVKTRKASAEEDVELAWASVDADYWGEWTNNSNIRREEYFDEDVLSAKLQKYLEGKGIVKQVIDNKDGTTTVKYKSEENQMNYNIIIDGSGEANIVGEAKHESQLTLADIITSKNYGDKVSNYTSNNQLSNWKIFYKKDDRVFLIASDYIPKGKVDLTITEMSVVNTTAYPYAIFWKTEPNNFHETKHIDLFRAGATNVYQLKETEGTSKCAAILLNTENWKNFLDTTGYGEYATGSPTVEMWMASWNEKYNDTLAYKPYSRIGYRVGLNSQKFQDEISLSDKEGYLDAKNNGGNMYWTHTNWKNTHFYWLASPSFHLNASSASNLLTVGYAGDIDGVWYVNYGGLRPVICLSKDVKGTQNEDGSWELSK